MSATSEPERNLQLILSMLTLFIITLVVYFAEESSVSYNVALAIFTSVALTF